MSSVEGGYNTVLVTQLGDEDEGCLNVTVKNTRSGGASITLALVPSTREPNWRRQRYPDAAVPVLPELLPGRGR